MNLLSTDIAMVCLIFMAGSFITVGNIKAINCAYEAAETAPSHSFFDEVWNNTAIKASVLLVVTLTLWFASSLTPMDIELVSVVLVSVFLGGVLGGTVVGVVAAFAAILGSKLSKRAAQILVALAAYGQLFVFYGLCRLG